MKYFLDTEFIEHFKKPIKWLPTFGSFNKPFHTIELISIGLVSSDGREYYAISNEFNPEDADDWVYKNVIQNIELEWVKSYSGDGRNKILDRIEGKGKYGAIRIMQNEIAKSNKEIVKDILTFMGCWRDQHFWRVGNDVPEIYGYYSDYDWVLFCSLFGRMVDLPKGFPMMCKDLKQIFDEESFNWFKKDDEFKKQYCFRNKLFSIEDDLKLLSNYPKQENEHNALEDARWNLKLYNFIKSLQTNQ